MSDYTGDTAHGLVQDVLAAIHKYDDTILLPTVLGCLDIVKAVLLDEHSEDNT